MKISYLVLLYALIFSSAKGQYNNPKTYSLKVEYGFHGPVKEVESYVVKVKEGVLPTDTTSFDGEYRLTFDRFGNGIMNYKKLKNDSGAVICKIIYAGKGRSISYKQIIAVNGEAPVESVYKYSWLTDYSYKRVPTNTDEYSEIVTLDSNYREIKMQSKQGDVQYTYHYKNVINNNRIEKTRTYIEREADTVTKSVNVSVNKAYDQQNNPIKIYFYDNLDDKKTSLCGF
jgi:hypothetical protein